MKPLLNGGIMDIWKDENLPSSQVWASTWALFEWAVGGIVGGFVKENLKYWWGSRKYFANASHFLSLPFGHSSNLSGELYNQTFQENSWIVIELFISKLKELVSFQTAQGS